MLDFPRWKIVSISLLLIFGVLMSIPSLLPQQVREDYWPSFMPQSTINLGLDLAGGSHILLEADPADIRAASIDTMEENIRIGMRTANPRIGIGDVSRESGALSFMVRDVEQVDAAREILQGYTNGVGLTGQRDWDIEVRDTTRFVMTPTDVGTEESLNRAMDSAIEVLRRRIDKLGTREPTIIRQGDNRIVIQVPGLDDPQQLKELVGTTAKLEFKLVDEAATQQIGSGFPSPGIEVYEFAEDQPQAGTSLAVRRSGGIQGENLTQANQAYDQQTNAPVVDIAFDALGGRRFAKLSGENVGSRFAIILDEKIISAPVFNEAILGGRAQISGSFTVESANTLAIALDSGALPVELKIVEERSVGPDLGQESIDKGAIAGIIGTIATLAFMIAVYGRFGVYANIALVLNLFLILGIMAFMNATLTLPGIAGFILTVGSAVDANVLINERIREERRAGRRIIQAIEVGYKEASRAIYDANITNIIAAILLFLFGSGPIKGFAVVLLIGIATSVFTAVFVTRMFVAIWVKNKRPKELVI